MHPCETDDMEGAARGVIGQGTDWMRNDPSISRQVGTEKIDYAAVIYCSVVHTGGWSAETLASLFCVYLYRCLPILVAPFWHPLCFFPLFGDSPIAWRSALALDLRLVGATRFERATSCSQSRRSTKLSTTIRIYDDVFGQVRRQKPGSCSLTEYVTVIPNVGTKLRPVFRRGANISAQ
jgi:hypothetical protein